MILGLGYKARSGKDIAAQYLCKKYDFNSMAFADPLKEACKIIYSLTTEQLYGNLKDVEDSFWKETPRLILQKVGTEGLRKGHRQDVWVKATERKLVDGIKRLPDKNWVISDCRFVNEIEMIKGHGGFAIKINGDFDGKKIINTPTHESENILNYFEGWDYVIDNNSTIEDFYGKLDKMILDLR